ncbi:hypothetical protein QAD02_014627 [Eretmocerus hayati]|uniref:Uncharacterized protein n=1 Tax=Eretmocerus hayati TaxID=131215 RepID=A0ACC2PAQ4_9HYME|nr:hypothetical protein QAD02_014627 [Eretmocerus hayati]
MYEEGESHRILSDGFIAFNRSKNFDQGSEWNLQEIGSLQPESLVYPQNPQYHSDRTSNPDAHLGNPLRQDPFLYQHHEDNYAIENYTTASTSVPTEQYPIFHQEYSYNISATLPEQATSEQSQTNHPTTTEESLVIHPLPSQEQLSPPPSPSRRSNHRSESPERDVENYQLRPSPCEQCIRKCNINFPQHQRQKINSSVPKLNIIERRNWLSYHMRECEIYRHVSRTDKSREKNVKYFLEDQRGDQVQVCKSFFLATTGSNYNNDRSLRYIIQYRDPVTKLMPSTPKKRVVKEGYEERMATIEEHIKSFHPSISHYRRPHAPHRKYLSSDISKTFMHKDFTEKHPHIWINYETYRNVVNRMNISFTKLGHEQCEMCVRFDVHHDDHKKDKLCTDCDECTRWALHNQRANDARRLHQSDVELSNSPTNKIKFYSVDLQKVIMLPWMETLKTALFTRRIVGFHESFVPLGESKTMSKMPIAMVWHEAIAGRKCEDIASAFHNFFLFERDAAMIVLWLDNCSGQNKNWTLISSIVELINSSEVETEVIELIFFEAGHTFMSADSFHHQVELSMKRMKSLQDFNDFVNAVQEANSGHVRVKALQPCDFRNWRDYSSKSKLSRKGRPYLNDIRKIQFRKNSHSIFYTLEYEERGCETFHEFDFLQVKIMKGFPPILPRSHPRGIPAAKKNDIIKRLVPLMNSSRRSFWLDIPTGEHNVDLIDGDDNEGL